MAESEILEVISKYQDEINIKYPQYTEYTSHCCTLITELLVCDYDDFSSQNKSMRYIKSILKEVVSYAFMSVGVKNYLKLIIGFFDDSKVKAFFSSTTIDEKQLYDTIDRLNNRITYWQGYGGRSERHLEHLIAPLT